MNVKEAKMVLRTHIAGHYLHQSEEFTHRNLRQLENCQLDNSYEKGMDVLVTLPNLESEQPERVDAHVSFMCDDVLCDDSAIHYGGEDFYALILDEIISISACFHRARE